MSLISSAVLFMVSFCGKPFSLYDILLNWDNISYSLFLFSASKNIYISKKWNKFPFNE